MQGRKLISLIICILTDTKYVSLQVCSIIFIKKEEWSIYTLCENINKYLRNSENVYLISIV